MGYGLMGTSSRSIRMLLCRILEIAHKSCLGFTWRPNAIPQTDAIKTMRKALSHGANYWNGGEFYGPPEANSLQLLAAYFSQHPEDADKVVINIKGATNPNLTPDGSEKGVRNSIDNCIRLLDGKKKLDIFECARVDPKVPIETTMKTLAACVKEGKITGISLSEVKAETIRRAHKIHPICGVEIELSLFQTEVLTNGVASTCAELGIPLIAYSPLGKGILTGQIKSPDDFPEGDFRKYVPRFSKENFPKNLELVKEVEKMAEAKGCKPSQLALAWVLQLSEQEGMPTIIPIPGASSVARVEENMGIVRLEKAEMERIAEILKSFEVVGDRYPEHVMAFCDG